MGLIGIPPGCAVPRVFIIVCIRQKGSGFQMAEEGKKGMESFMAETRTFPPPADIKANAYVTSLEQYQQMWTKSIEDPDGFWLEQARSLSWFKEPTKSLEYTWDTKARKIEHTWFADGELNVSYNCLDRHLGTPIAGKTAILWQGEAEDAVRKITYEELHREVCRFANSGRSTRLFSAASAPMRSRAG